MASMTFLGAFNFLVLQWFGVRLARVAQRELPGPWLHFASNEARIAWARGVTVGYKLLRWVWPLTGWWSDYRWIARRP